jgi:hypothetical protein
MEGKNLLEFRNNFHNFRNSIKFSMNFYRFKLALARLKLTYIIDTRYIYFILLEPRTDQDLHEEIYFTIFLFESKSLQIFEICNIFEPKLKKLKNRNGNWANSRQPSCTQCTRPAGIVQRGRPIATSAQWARQPTASGQRAGCAHARRA